jgi:hypothetical protein
LVFGIGISSAEGAEKKEKMEYEKVFHFNRFHANQTEEFKIIRILK